MIPKVREIKTLVRKKKLIRNSCAQGFQFRPCILNRNVIVFLKEQKFSSNRGLSKHVMNNPHYTDGRTRKPKAESPFTLIEG